MQSWTSGNRGARARLADPALATAWTEGQAMTTDQAVDYAIGD